MFAGGPTATGHFAFTVRAADACDAMTERPLTLEVADFSDLQKPNAKRSPAASKRSALRSWRTPNSGQ